ncbi:MAG: 6-phosphofructokinase [Chloroflexi bacterium]|nr:6-phosphofructokinase [Chloroflexota bacterium]
MGSKLRGGLIVGQSGGPSGVINASLAGVVETALEHPEFTSVLGMVHGIEGALKEDLFDLSREDAQTIHGLVGTTASALGTCRHKVKPAEYGRLLEVFQAHNIRYFIYLGGNDSMDTAYQMGKLAADSGYEMRIMGVPKTIDNDLDHTDHTPGFGSAARYVAISTMDAGRDLEAMSTYMNVSILETMGRHAGWLAAAAVMGKRDEYDPPHLVYLPERTFDEAQFLADIQRVHRTIGHVMVVVSEGIQDASGALIGAKGSSAVVDAFGHKAVAMGAGVSPYLADLVRNELGFKVIYNRPGTLQRSGTPGLSRTDLEEAYMVGRVAVQKALEGVTGQMVTLERHNGVGYRCTYGLAPLDVVANAEKLLPDEFIDESGTMPSHAFVEYARPLLGDPLPVHVRLHGVSVPKRTPTWKGK